MQWCWGGEICNPPEGVAVCPVAVCEERRERGVVVVVVGEATIGETSSWAEERRGQRVIIRAGAGRGGGWSCFVLPSHSCSAQIFDSMLDQLKNVGGDVLHSRKGQHEPPNWDRWESHLPFRRVQVSDKTVSDTWL